MVSIIISPVICYHISLAFGALMLLIESLICSIFLVTTSVVKVSK